MTAESLKPFLNLPNATAADLKVHCAQRSSVKRYLAVLGCILVAATCVALVGVQIWHLNRTAALEREVDDLKLQLQQYRAGEFNDYEFDNELFVNPDEYDAGYAPDLDLILPGEREAGDLLESGLASSGMLDDDEDNDEETGRDHSRNEEDGRRDEDDEDGDNNDGDEYDDDPALYESEDISVTAAVAGGKRRARSISGVTRQGVPIVDEPYVPRRNRTRQPHRIFEQLRQRPEEVVTPPTSAEMFRWDVEGRSSQASHRTANSQQQAYGSISIRPFPQESHHRRDHHTPSTSPMPAYSSPANHQLYYSRNELNAGNPTKAPAQILNRMSRVQTTNDENKRERPQPHRFPKVISNPGTQKELVRSPETRVRMRYRKAGGQSHAAEPLAKGVHFVKQNVGGVRHQDKHHKHWSLKGDASSHAIESNVFRLENDALIVREPGLYYVYAQVMYDNKGEKNGFNVKIKDQIHLSCTVHTNSGYTNTCFTAGLAKIDEADTSIVIYDIENSRPHVMLPEKTFFGAFKVGRLPAVASQQLRRS
uniref:THD domain-containing protein n=1 Tax=Anopheles atroparvus TaxID=41427 RepID=A0A182IQQ5_ANOAO